MRKALAAGIEKPTEAVNWIKSKFDIDVTASFFSTFKTQEAKKANPTPKPTAAKTVQKDSGIELALKVKELVRQYGADAVKQWAEVVS